MSERPPLEAPQQPIVVSPADGPNGPPQAQLDAASMFSRAVTEAKADRDRALDERDAAQDACSLAELEVKRLREELERVQVCLEAPATWSERVHAAHAVVVDALTRSSTQLTADSERAPCGCRYRPLSVFARPDCEVHGMLAEGCE